MADAYGKLTGRPGICFVTRAPGATHAAVGVYTAYQDSTPLILFVGQVPRSHRGREAFQELDYTRMFAETAKWVVEAEEAAALPELVARAFHVATSGRPGPVVVALPEDVLGDEADVADAARYEAFRPAPAAADLQRVHELLARAERPLVVVGGGGWTQQAAADLQAWAEASELPVAASFRRQDYIDNTSPSYCGRAHDRPRPRARRAPARRRRPRRTRNPPRRDPDPRLHDARAAANAATRSSTCTPSRKSSDESTSPTSRSSRTRPPSSRGCVHCRRSTAPHAPGGRSRRTLTTSTSLEHRRGPGELDLGDVIAHLRERLPATRSSRTAPATSASGCTASTRSGSTTRNSRRVRARWATASRRRSRRRSSTPSGSSSASPATATS